MIYFAFLNFFPIFLTFEHERPTVHAGCPQIAVDCLAQEPYMKTHFSSQAVADNVRICSLHPGLPKFRTAREGEEPFRGMLLF